MYRFDVDHGGFGLTKDIPAEFLQSTTSEEKHQVAQWVHSTLHLLEAAKPHGHDGYQWKYDYARTPDVALKAAERTEEVSPHASIDLYQQHIEHLITGRGRGNYQVACQYLVKIRSLYEKLDEPEQWTNYIASLRKLHSRLPTLKEELTVAGL